MISPARATTVLGGAAVVNIFVGVIAAKVIAVRLGPAGVGLYGLQLSILNWAALIFGLGIGTGLVRELATRASALDPAGIVAYRRAALLTALGTGCLAALLMLAFRRGLAQAFLGSVAREADIPILALAVVVSLIAGVYIATLNGYHLVRVVARVSIVSSVAGGALNIAAVMAMGENGLAVGQLLAAMATFTVAAFALWGHGAIPGGRVAGTRMLQAAGSLLRFGLPYTASQIVGTGAQLAVPLVILNLLTQESVGQFRAASAIAIGYAALFANAMAQDYYPRLSSVAGDRARWDDAVRNQLRLILRISVPLIFALMTVAPFLVGVMYSSEFQESSSVLRWLLVGDLLKLPAWTLATVLLAAGASRAFFGVELAGGVSLLVLTVVATSSLGLVGAGLAYAAMYAVYYQLVATIGRRAIGLKLGTILYIPPLLAGIGAVSVGLGDLLGDPWRTILLGGLTFGSGVAAIRGIRGERLGEG